MPKKKKYNYLELLTEDSYTRNFNLELYESWNNDNLIELQEKDNVNYSYKTCDEVIKFIEDNYLQYGYIKHDKDIWTKSDYELKKEYMISRNINIGDPKKTHYHVVVKFKNPRYKSTVAKELGIPFDKVVRCISIDSSLKYDIHLDEDDKFQYDIDDFKGPLRERLIKLCQKYVSEEDKSNDVINIIISKRWKLPDLLREINKYGLYSHFIRGSSIYKKILEESNCGVYYDVIGSWSYNLADDDDVVSIYHDGLIDISKFN